ncbi:hypothetical protein Tco_1348589 [Tanacetum coccineum]
MATMAKNVIAAGFENRPPMLEKGMYNSWKTQIILYIRGKDNGDMLIESINKGPFKLIAEITVKDTDGITDIAREHIPHDLSPKQSLRYDSDIKAVNFLLLRLPVDIYTLINHYHTAKEIWDCVKELMEGTEMTKQEHCDDQATTSAIFMASHSLAGLLNDDTVAPTYDSNTLFEVPHYDTYHDDVLNFVVQEAEYTEHSVSHDDSYAEFTSDSNVISYAEYMVTIEDEAAHYVPPPIQDKDMILSVTKQMKSQVEQCNTVKQKAKSMNESLTTELEKYKERVKTLEKEYSSKQFLTKREAFLDSEL